jgi:hypothetical protein
MFGKFIFSALAAAVLSQAPAQAQQNWKVASAAQPGTPLIAFVDEIVSKVGSGSKGAIKAERLFIGSEQEIAQQIVRGRIEMAGISMAGTAPLIPEAGLLTTPYLWSSAAERDYVARTEENLRSQGPGHPGHQRSGLERRRLQKGLPDPCGRQGHEGASRPGDLIQDLLVFAGHKRRSDAIV